MKSFISFSLLFSSTLAWSVECPQTFTGAQLNSFRNRVVEKVKVQNYAEAKSDIETCFPTKKPACYDNLDYFVKLRLGEVSTSEHFAQNELTISSVNGLPPEFVSNGSLIIPENILEVSKDKGWPNVLYKTRGQGGFDSGENLFIVAIPGEKQDIFIQTSPYADATMDTAKDPIPNPSRPFHNAQSQVTVITVDKTQNPPVGQLRLMYTNGDNPRTYSWTNTTSTSDCISCHTVPLRPISPVGYKEVNEENKMTPAQIAQVDVMNRLLEQPVSWGKTKVGNLERKFGPAIDTHPLGWAPANSRTRQEQFLKACATRNTSYSNNARGGRYNVQVNQKSPPTIDYNKLAGAMNCIECHDNKNRGVLSEDFRVREVIFKVIVDRSMPRGVDLNMDERIALVNCLSAERTELQQDWRQSGEWMKKASCFGTQFQGTPPQPVRNTSPSNNSNSGSSTTRQ